MISRPTAAAILEQIHAWATRHNVAPAAVEDLLSRIAAVSGNRSFRETMQLLCDLIRKDGPRV